VNPPKCNEYDYIDFLIATPKIYSCTEAARAQPEADDAPAHDSINRLLARLETDSQHLWQEASHQVEPDSGVLILDDSTLDKQYARKIDLVRRHWSGKHRKVVMGINLITLLWTDGERYIPCDYRLFDKPTDGATKNDHFRQMLYRARERGFSPESVLFDSWYASIENLKTIRGFGWIWLTQLKGNRQVDPDRGGNRALSEVEVGETGRVVHLKAYGLIRVFKIVAKDGSIEYWATNKVEMSELERLKYAEMSQMIEQYHRGIKQFCGVERCQARRGRVQRNHIGLALRAFLRLEHHCYYKGISWFEAKASITREAVRVYLAKPLFTL
jgi:hypothetical protein